MHSIPHPFHLVTCCAATPPCRLQGLPKAIGKGHVYNPRISGQKEIFLGIREIGQTFHDLGVKEVANAEFEGRFFIEHWP